ncbi:hypothetical protein KY334_06620 [Candidatus Woesearchaeota archaeon]|nr:hypothetical protein [Candidatus Woesearchaeota archaeon]
MDFKTSKKIYLIGSIILIIEALGIFFDFFAGTDEFMLSMASIELILVGIALMMISKADVVKKGLFSKKEIGVMQLVIGIIAFIISLTGLLINGIKSQDILLSARNSEAAFLLVSIYLIASSMPNLKKKFKCEKSLGITQLIIGLLISFGALWVGFFNQGFIKILTSLTFIEGLITSILVGAYMIVSSISRLEKKNLLRTQKNLSKLILLAGLFGLAFGTSYSSGGILYASGIISSLTGTWGLLNASKNVSKKK